MSMNTLGQSGPQKPLPGDLQARIENAQNSVTMAETEYSRLLKLIDNQKTEISNLAAQKLNLEKSVNKLNDELEGLVKDVAQERLVLAEAENSTKHSKAVLSDLYKEIETNRTSIVQKNAELDKREQGIQDHESDIQKRSRVLLEKEIAHEVKVAKLKEAIT